jgi:hypothetical protein
VTVVTREKLPRFAAAFGLGGIAALSYTRFARRGASFQSDPGVSSVALGQYFAREAAKIAKESSQTSNLRVFAASREKRLVGRPRV